MEPPRGTATLCGQEPLFLCVPWDVSDGMVSEERVVPYLPKAVGVMSWGLSCGLDIRVRGEPAYVEAQP